MDFRQILLILTIFVVQRSLSETDDIPYEPVAEACTRCTCLGLDEDPNAIHLMLDCSTKGLKHILADWPSTFGTNHTGKELIVLYSGNEINVLQQLPESESFMSFSCRHCELTEIRSAIFLDVPNIQRLDLSWNKLTGDALRADIFRGRFNANSYEPLALEEIDLSHNLIHSLERRLFEHTPRLRTVSLAYNPLSVLDPVTSLALGSVKRMEHLDLSYTDIASIPDDLFHGMLHLRELLIQGNRLLAVPESLGRLGKSLKSLYIGDNLIRKLDDESFFGLKHLTHLNISRMPQMEEIGENTFSSLKKLEVLLCRNNPQMTKFDLNSLRTLKKLRELDLSNCSLRTLEVDSSADVDLDFPKLRVLKLDNNQWHCDCQLFMALNELEHHGSNEFRSDDDARCATPYDLAGTLLSDLLKKPMCSSGTTKKKEPRDPGHELPPFLRPKSIVLSILSVIAVITIGLIVGFGIVYIRKKLRKTDFGFTANPVRYTSVRNSYSTATTTTTVP